MKQVKQKQKKLWTNYKNKEHLEEAVKLYNDYIAAKKEFMPCTIGAMLVSNAAQPSPVRYYQPGFFEGNEPREGTFCVEGPHYPKPHMWYATCTAKDGVIVGVK